MAILKCFYYVFVSILFFIFLPYLILISVGFQENCVKEYYDKFIKDGI